MNWLSSKKQRELKRLQDAYYDGSSKDDSVIREYLRVLKELREREFSPTARTTRLHLGSGGHRIEGWINLDMLADGSVDLISDLRAGLPFRNASIDLIHSEDLIEHLDQQVGTLLVRESFRVLSRGGVMRLVTPDLKAIVEHVYLERQTRHLRWCAREFGAMTACEALNIHMRMGGEHRFLYDETQLRATLEAAGFKTRRVSFNTSSEPDLRFLDLRNFGLSLYLEATKT